MGARFGRLRFASVEVDGTASGVAGLSPLEPSPPDAAAGWTVLPVVTGAACRYAGLCLSVRGPSGPLPA